MFCRITDMHDKEVINVCDGTRIGCVDARGGRHLHGSARLHRRAWTTQMHGVAGHDEDIVISWKEIEVIGEETILVNHPLPPCCPGPRPRKNGILGGIFGGK